jgi:hypothetical protein
MLRFIFSLWRIEDLGDGDFANNLMYNYVQDNGKESSLWEQ